jgi:MFS family permease
VSNRRLVLAFGVITGLFAAGYGVMFTVLDDFRDTYGIAGGSLGLIVAAGFFASFAAQVFFGPLADRGHARRLVVIGMIVEVVGLVAMAVGRDVVVLLLARIVMGLGAGVAQPAVRRIVIMADPEHLGTNIGRLLAADVAGFTVGPALSAVLVGPLGIAAPFLVIAVATTAFIPVIARVSANVEAPAPGTPDHEQPAARFAFDLLRQRAYVGALCFGAAVFLMIGTFDSLWVLVLDDLHTSDWIANLGIILFAIPLMLLGSVGGRLAQRVGPFRTGTVGLLLGSMFIFAYGQLPTGMAMFALSMFHAVSDGLTVSSSGVAVGQVAPAQRQAGAQGLLGGVQTLVGGLAALVAGRLYQGYGRGTAYGAASIAMIVLVIAGLVCVGRSKITPRRLWS